MDLLTSSGGMVLLACTGTAVMPSILPYVPTDIIKFINVGSCSVSFGAQFWVGSIAGLTMFKVLKRQTFGRVQSKLFPKYAMLNTSCSLLALVTYLQLNEIGPTDGLSLICDKWEGLLLICGLLGNLANTLYFIPATTQLMFKIYARENLLGLEEEIGKKSPLNSSDKATDDDKKLLKRFRISHGCNMIMSLISIGTCGAYLNFIAQNLEF